MADVHELDLRERREPVAHLQHEQGPGGPGARRVGGRDAHLEPRRDQLGHHHHLGRGHALYLAVLAGGHVLEVGRGRDVHRRDVPGLRGRLRRVLHEPRGLRGAQVALRAAGLRLHAAGVRGHPVGGLLRRRDPEVLRGRPAGDPELRGRTQVRLGCGPGFLRLRDERRRGPVRAVPQGVRDLHPGLHGKGLRGRRVRRLVRDVFGGPGVPGGRVRVLHPGLHREAVRG